MAYVMKFKRATVPTNEDKTAGVFEPCPPGLELIVEFLDKESKFD